MNAISGYHTVLRALPTRQRLELRTASAPKPVDPVESFQAGFQVPPEPPKVQAPSRPEEFAPPPPLDRSAVIAKLPLTSPLRSIDTGEIPDVTFRLIDTYENLRSQFPSQMVEKGRTVMMVPAYNEEDNIEDTLESLREHGGRRDIIVSLNNTTDNTAAVVQAWAQKHPEVDLIPIQEDTGKVPPAAPGHQRVFLLDSPEPGKTGAMMRPLQFLKNQGSLPEHIFSIDADTHLGPGQLDHLHQTARQRSLHAVCGKIKFEVEPGEKLSVMNQVTNRIHGEKGFETLCGGFTLYKSEDFFPGYQAIKQVVPGVFVEDGVFGHLVAAAGRGVGVDTQVPFRSLGVTAGQQTDSQRSRWVAGGAQLEKLFAPVFDSVGSGGVDDPLAVVTTQVKAIWRDHSLGDALLKTLGISCQIGEGLRALADKRRGEEADLGEAYHWEPPRDN